MSIGWVIWSNFSSFLHPFFWALMLRSRFYRYTYAGKEVLGLNVRSIVVFFETVRNGRSVSICVHRSLRTVICLNKFH